LNLPAISNRRPAWAPTTLREAMDYAEMVAGTDMIPAAYRGKPGNVLIAMDWGREIGLSPLQALQNIAVIGGRPAVWGDAVIALIMAHPDFVSIHEGTRGEGDAREGFCRISRRNREPKEHVFSWEQAKRAKLSTKSGPWQEYPDRMLMLRARGFAARDTFPDVLRGILTYEEARDMRDVPNLAEGEPEIERGPIVAEAGSLREMAGEIVGRSVERPAPEEDEALPLVAPDGTLATIRKSAKGNAPAAVVWVAAAERALRSITARAKLAEWLQWNAPHFDAMRPRYPAEVEEVLALAQSRETFLFRQPVQQPEAGEGAAPPA
jgi:hypothetical protein